MPGDIKLLAIINGTAELDDDDPDNPLEADEEAAFHRLAARLAEGTAEANFKTDSPPPPPNPVAAVTTEAKDDRLTLLLLRRTEEEEEAPDSIPSLFAAAAGGGGVNFLTAGSGGGGDNGTGDSITNKRTAEKKEG